MFHSVIDELVIMYKRLLDFLICPECEDDLQCVDLELLAEETKTGVLYCSNGHYFPIVGGVPRMLPDSLVSHWNAISGAMPDPVPDDLKPLLDRKELDHTVREFDVATRANFSNEWDNHDIGDRTWTMDLKDRVRWFFLESIGISKEDLAGKVLVDAGCGNGSQSVAYTEFGLEVLAVDLSTGLEKGYAFRNVYNEARPSMVHFVQADLQRPPFRKQVADIIHSAGVMHHTPNTERTFRAVAPLLKPDGTLYVWLYKYEKIVTPIVNSIRAVTTRLPAPVFAAIAKAGALPFIGFCWTVNKLGIRQYETPAVREAVLGLHDIFGAPYAHYHSYPELAGWYESIGITDYWPVNESRRGFGICGQKHVTE